MVCACPARPHPVSAASVRKTQIRSGALGEMLQEAQLDRRILIESEDDEESDPDEDEEDVFPTARRRPRIRAGFIMDSDDDE